MNKKSSLKIFKNLLNNKYQQIPFNVKLNDLRKIKYLPPVSKEWKNNIYSFDKNKMRNISINDININKIIESYFNLHFKNKFIDYRFISCKRRRLFLRKIYASNAEIKHVHNKAIITIYTINPEKKRLYKNYLQSLKFIRKISKDRIPKYFISFLRKINNSSYNITSTYLLKYKLLGIILTHYNLLFKEYLKKSLSLWIYTIRKYIYSYNLNKFKFENTFFLPKLSNLLSKILNKEIEYNIVNLKSFLFSANIFTDALTKKLKRRKASILNGMYSMLNRARLPKVNTIIERANLSKIRDNGLIENKYKDINLISILNKKDFNKFLIRTYNTKIYSLKKNLYLKIDNSIKYRNILINSIKYKNMGGIRLTVKGRLTKRYRADRTVYKLKWKGGLRNIDSSYNKLSSVLFRGNSKSNVTESMSKSKRRVGSYAVKGWISGK